MRLIKSHKNYLPHNEIELALAVMGLGILMLIAFIIMVLIHEVIH